MLDRKKPSKSNAIWSVILTTICSVALCVQYDGMVDSTQQIIVLFASALMFVGFLVFIPHIDPKINKWAIPLAILFALITVVSQSLFAFDQFVVVAYTLYSRLFFVIRYIGYAILFYFALQGINKLYLMPQAAPALKRSKRQEFLLMMGVLLLCWLPYMLIYYPACMNGDTPDQLAQICGNREYCWSILSVTEDPTVNLWNTVHSPFHTWTISWFTWLGEKVGSYRVGFAAYSYTQCVLLAATCVYLLQKIRGHLGNHWAYKAAIFFFALNPMLPLWGMTIVKDTPSAIANVFTVVLLYEMIASKEKQSWKKYTIFGAVLLMDIVLRRNAIYAMLVMLPLVAIKLWKNKQALVKMVATLVLPMIIYQTLIAGWLYPALNIAKGGTRIIYSIPFQQTARFIQDNPDDVSPEEEAVILKVLQKGDTTLEEIAKSYLPVRADPVIRLYNNSNTKEDMIEYMKTWAKMGMRDPGTYAQALGEMLYGWFFTDNKTDIPYYKGIISSESNEMFQGAYNAIELQPYRDVVVDFVRALSSIPWTAWLVEFSYYTWAYLAFLLIMVARKKTSGLVALSYIWINYLLFFMGSTAYMRYAIPALFLFPYAFAITFMRETPIPNENTKLDETTK